MNRLKHTKLNQQRRAHRIRTVIRGNSSRPRLSVNISNIHVSAQIIDDSKGITLAYATTVGHKTEGNLTSKAEWVGQEIASKAKKSKISQVVFDRGPKQYHGRVKALADAARKDGLEF
jgi:large subunit ribosomal protein L18